LKPLPGKLLSDLLLKRLKPSLHKAYSHFNRYIPTGLIYLKLSFRISAIALNKMKSNNMTQYKKLRPVSIFDTTLRDGEQSPGYSLTLEQKVQLAQQLEELGVNTIETGFPMSSKVDFEATREICKLLKKAQPCGFARAKREDIEACAQAMTDAVKPQIELASVGSDIHMSYKRKVTREQIIHEATDAIKCAKSFGFKDISLALEDATRGDREFMKNLIGSGLELGITAIAIPDTVGCCLPEEFRALIQELRDFTGPDIRISIHCHNDMGLAVANSIAGLMGGADEVQTTLCGIGERAGNACLEELIAVLSTKQNVLHCVHTVVNHKLYDTCHYLIDLLNLKLPRHKAIVGENAFSSEAGMHQQGLIKHRFTYEWLRAEDYGTSPKMVVGRHSGRHLLHQCLLEQGVRPLDDVLVDKLYNIITESDTPELYNIPQILLERYNGLQEETYGTHNLPEEVEN
jgi:2-isopropylmalate synthase